MAKKATAVKEKPGKEEKSVPEPAQDSPKKKAQALELSEVQETEGPDFSSSIEILLDMNVPLTVTIGKTEIPVRRLLRLGPGSVLRLDKPIDAPADLYMRQTRFATGTVVVVEDRFAVKITNIIGRKDDASSEIEPTQNQG